MKGSIEMTALDARATAVKAFGALAIATFLLTTNAGAALSGARQTVNGHVVMATRNMKSIGQLADSERVHISIVLPWRDQAGLTTFLDQLYDPASPNYRKFLTPEVFAKQFGPSEDDYAAVQKFARDNQLKVLSTS